ncbi:protein kinase [Noviherbaspirillum sp. CPCC 100848]|uniref:Protein kinase n=1 Tax=Noviherbaspirillum album TaxID=3080276 RepID=A0ABU6J3W0_9BURK|nr:protein kinase [Noviherbaspirillum sp. CPCC 100848]MEC4718017.1 protein kinase [Noviherbaspirillum sp. CPCC 100848]
MQVRGLRRGNTVPDIRRRTCRLASFPYWPDDMEFDNDRTVVRTGHRTSRVPNDGMGGAMNTLPIGTRLGEFEIKDLIGEGGFGIVYLAYDHSLERHVALKEYMPSGMAARTQARQVTVRSRQYEDTFVTGLRSFINEARLLARFDSPSLVKVYRFWEENGTAYMAMPFYDGVTLKQAYKEQRITPDEEWTRALLANMFDALETIHREQCFHRDVAPDNILLLKDGRPLLLDFGAARRVIGDLTQGPTVILKPGFAPIEQYADIPGLRQGAWTDIYALGAVVYYLITGKAPSPAVSRVVHDDMMPARAAGRGRFSDEFLGVIDRALAVKPEHRIQSVPEMRHALDMEGTEPRPLPGSSGAARSSAPRPGAAARTGQGSPAVAAGAAELAARTGMAGAAARTATASATAVPRQATRGMPPPTPPKDADDWKKPMIGDQRYIPQARNRMKMGMIATVLLAAGATTAVFGYRWVASQDTVQADTAAPEPQYSRDPGIPRVAGGVIGSAGIPGTPKPPATRGAGTPAGASTGGSSGGGSSGSSASGGDADASMQKAPAAPAQAVAGNAMRSRDFIPPPENRDSGPTAPSRDKTYAGVPPQAMATTPGGSPSASPPASSADTAEDKLWNGAKNTDTTEGYKAYLKRYPKGKFAPAARVLAEERQRMDLAKLSEPPERQARAGNERAATAGTAATAVMDLAKLSEPPERQARAGNERAATAGTAATAVAPETSGSTSGDRKETASASPAAAPEQQIAKYTAPAKEAPSIIAPEQPRGEAARPPDPREDSAAPPASTSGPQRTYTFPGQTMVGNFSADPVTGLVSGTGQIRWDNGDRFEGRLVKGIKEGKGRFVWSNGQEYNGDWSGDKPNGRGVLKFANGNRYDGEIRDGQPHGQGTTRFQSGDVYTGNWVRGVLNGRGVLQFATGDRYEGELRNGEPDGQGRTRFRSGDTYVGQWARGKHHGQGRYTWQSGNYWEGEFRDGDQTANGQLVRMESGTVQPTAAGDGIRGGQAAESSGR